jgi:hypothetical protein
MTHSGNQGNSDSIIATIENRDNPGQVISIKYLKGENAFVTSGIRQQMGIREIMIPAHLVTMDFELVGTIIAAVLEKISSAHETDRVFEYVSRFEVLDKVYSLTEYGDYIKLEEV